MSQKRFLCLMFKELHYNKIWIFSMYVIRLLNNEGALLAYSGYDDKNARVTAAIASTVWASCFKNGYAAFNEEQLKFILLDEEDGKIAITRVANLLLCICAKKSVEYGILKAKSEAIAKYLEVPLNQIATSS
ncbi:Ragulator complex protein LAMTOR2 [Nymphon striatum]|nr:Ragulator complex protein LAMTOR2 [Nymphon striatum]